MLAIAAWASGVRSKQQFTVSLRAAVPADWLGRGATIRTAFWMIVRRAQDRAQLRKT